jgi:pimeloyl-ACP methyl ester carboxylesterase
MSMLRRFVGIVLTFMSLVLFGVMGAAAQVEGTVFVLVHGAFQDASTYDAVVPLIEANGDTAVTVNLGGRAGDETPFGELTLESYRDAVVAAIEAQAQPVILVGHSFGGMVISTAAEAVPDRVEALVYLAAYLARSGESLVTLSSQDQYSQLGQEGVFQVSEDFTTASVLESAFAGAFCPDCDDAQATAVAASQLPEPLAPLNEPVTLTAEAFGSVYKAYVMTAQDMVVTPQLQALMIANTPVDHVYALDAGHALYVTQPEALVAILEDVASEE